MAEQPYGQDALERLGDQDFAGDMNEVVGAKQGDAASGAGRPAPRADEIGQTVGQVASGRQPEQAGGTPGQATGGVAQDVAQDPQGNTLGGIGGTASGGQVDADEQLWQGEQPPDEKEVFGES